MAKRKTPEHDSIQPCFPGMEVSPPEEVVPPKRQTPVILTSQIRTWGLTWEAAALVKGVKIGGKRKSGAIKLETALQESRKRRMRVLNWKNEQEESS